MFFQCGKSALFIRAIAGCVAALIAAPSVFSQQSSSFDVVAGAPTGEFVWDVFNGPDFDGDHTPDVSAVGIGNAFVSASENPVPPGGIVTGDLYTHFSVPRFNVNLSSAEASSSFTSIAVQVAITQSFTPPALRTNLIADSFSLTGVGGPDEFQFLGARTTIPGNGGPEDVDYFWAEWIGVDASADLEITIQGSGQFQTLTAIQATYFNTDTPLNITAIPEPSAGVLPLLFCISFLKRRRN